MKEEYREPEFGVAATARRASSRIYQIGIRISRSIKRLCVVADAVGGRKDLRCRIAVVGETGALTNGNLPGIIYQNRIFRSIGDQKGRAMGFVACPMCRSTLNVPAEWKDKKVRCRSCAHIFVAVSSPAGPTQRA